MARGSNSREGRTARSEAGDRLRERARALDQKAERLEAKQALKEKKKIESRQPREFYQNPDNGVTKEKAIAVDNGTKLFAKQYKVPTTKQMLALSGLDAKAIKDSVAVGKPAVTQKQNGGFEVSQVFEYPYSSRDNGSPIMGYSLVTMDLIATPKESKAKVGEYLLDKAGAFTTSEQDANRMKYRGSAFG